MRVCLGRQSAFPGKRRTPARTPGHSTTRARHAWGRGPDGRWGSSETSEPANASASEQSFSHNVMFIQSSDPNQLHCVVFLLVVSTWVHRMLALSKCHAFQWTQVRFTYFFQPNNLSPSNAGSEQVPRISMDSNTLSFQNTLLYNVVCVRSLQMIGKSIARPGAQI